MALLEHDCERNSVTTALAFPLQGWGKGSQEIRKESASGLAGSLVRRQRVEVGRAGLGRVGDK